MSLRPTGFNNTSYHRDVLTEDEVVSTTEVVDAPTGEVRIGFVDRWVQRLADVHPAAWFTGAGALLFAMVFGRLGVDHHNNFGTWSYDMLNRHGVSAIAGIDTRRLTRVLRDTGAMPGAFGSADEASLRRVAAAEPGTDGIDLVADVTCESSYETAATGRSDRRIVAFDFGIKQTMGIDSTFGRAFYKAELAAGTVLPTEGTVFLSLADGDKPAGIVVARKLRELGFSIAATTGTADYLASFGVSVDAVVGKIYEGHGINAVNLIAGGDVDFVINTPQGQGGGARSDGEQIRKAAITHRVSSVTTVEAALAAVQGMAEKLTDVRKAGAVPYLRPDGKTQVTFEYDNTGKPTRLVTALISTQHQDGVDRDTVIRPDLIEQVIRPVVPAQFADDDYNV